MLGTSYCSSRISPCSDREWKKDDSSLYIFGIFHLTDPFQTLSFLPLFALSGIFQLVDGRSSGNELQFQIMVSVVTLLRPRCFVVVFLKVKCRSTVFVAIRIIS